MNRKTACSSVVPSDGPAPAGSTRTSWTIQGERRLLRTLMNINRGFVKSIDAYALVLVLLATVTYPTFSQPPGSFDDDGLMRTSRNPRLLWFVYLNSFSFFFSMTDLLLCISGKYAPMTNLRIDPRVDMEQGDPKTKEELAEFNDQLAHSVLFTLTKLLVINVLFVLSLTCCIAAYISAGSAVQQLTISNRLSIIIPGIGGCLLYFVFVVWLFLDFALFFRSARSGSIVDCFTDFCTMIWLFLFPGGSSCTQQRFGLLAQRLAHTARLWKVQQLFDKASDEINCYDQNIPAPSSATRNNTPHELYAAEQTSQQQQQGSTETSNNAAAAAATSRAQQSADNNNAATSSSTAFRPLTSPAAVNAAEWQQQQAQPAHRKPARTTNSQDFPSFRGQTSVQLSARSPPRVQALGKVETHDDDKEAEEEEEEGGHGPDAEADLHGPVTNSRTSLGVRYSSFRCSTCYGIPCVCGTGLP
ncbi:unnamed protein product [Sphagnum troendelagicum]|uniref:PGG domain-containing protein n=1 Tax=Sphagnum troendelagicum TaxID=128251 RepID=A0ABP0TU50_9BRYO